MKIGKMFLVLVVAVSFGLTSVVQAEIHADLAVDYTEAGVDPNDPNTWTTAIFDGTVTGIWTCSSDVDTDPLNDANDLVPLVYHDAVGLEGGDGYAGTGAIYGNCCGPMPIISDDGLFDGVITPPEGMLAVHPGGSAGSHTAPEYLVIQYTATTDMTNVVVAYDVNSPGNPADANHDGIDLTIVDNAGTVLFAGGDGPPPPEILAGQLFLASLGAGESVYLVLGNGPVGDAPGADQTWANVRILPAP